MKMMEYPSIKKFAEDNVLITDGNNGTKKINVVDAVLSALALSAVCNRRQIFRGKNLGNALTTEQKAAIQSGTFDDLCLGDYWEIGGVKFRIADFDYWYNRGDVKFTNHHLVIVPDSSLGATKVMNATSVTTGGYVGSQMYTTHLSEAKNIASSAFGSAVLTHREFLTNEVANGYPSAGAWTASSVDLMNEIMVYGCYIYTPANSGATDVKRFTVSNSQLALFRACPELLVSESGFWLRDVVSATHFARVDGYGGATSAGGANAYGVRPVFAIG